MDRVARADVDAANAAAAVDAPADAEEALVQFLYQAPIGLLQIRRDGTVDMANPMSAQLLLPIAAGGALDNLFDTLRDVAPELRARVGAFAERAGVVLEGLRLRVGTGGDDGFRIVSLSVVRLAVDRFMASLVDVTLDVERESRGMERRLHDVARQDGLTRLPNRTAAVEAVRAALAGADPRPLTVLSIHVDRFRRINDGFGHAVGDTVLVRIGERVLSTLRDAVPRGERAGLPLAARTGGNEFAVVLDGCGPGAEAERLAEAFLLTLAFPHVVGAQRIHAPVRIGAVVACADPADPACGRAAEEILHDAALAAAEAKRLGGGRCVVFEPALRERAARRGALEEDLRRALLDDELFVVYQPVVAFGAGGTVDRSAGVEALVRWRHPQRGLVGPADFVPVAEESGLIGRVGALVLESACAQHAAWRRQLGPAAPRVLAVNLSRAQLDEADLVERVRQTLARHAMEPADLQLEVTESLAAQDDRVQARLRELKALGLTLALDDFGTGYSSLASLHQLPVDTVKIDRAFVQHVDASAHHRALVEATVKVARSLGMRTVAEGVETEAQARAVRALGCDKGQGWLFGRPVEGAALAAWLRAAPGAG
jgi:diguanylate cyclase (GGDEF)-like protein